MLTLSYFSLEKPLGLLARILDAVHAEIAVTVPPVTRSVTAPAAILWHDVQTTLFAIRPVASVSEFRMSRTETVFAYPPLHIDPRFRIACATVDISYY